MVSLLNEVIKIRLGKKDYITRTWWDNASKAGITLSSVINCAVHHYAKTGQYVAIAQIKDVRPTEEQSPVIRQIYLPKESTAYKWLTEKKDEGEKISSTIKRILRNSIILADSEILYSEDELKNCIDMIESGMYAAKSEHPSLHQGIQTPVYSNPIMYQTGGLNAINVSPAAAMAKTNTVTKSDNSSKQDRSKYIVTEKEHLLEKAQEDRPSWHDSEDDPGGPDLYENLLGGARLSLGTAR